MTTAPGADASVRLDLTRGGDPWGSLALDAVRAAADPGAALGIARRWDAVVPSPGAGETVGRWEALATLGAADLTVARTLEPHLDALAILREAGLEAPSAGRSWGVWAAEGPGVRLEARAAEGDGRWVLEGTKPWCSLAGLVTHGLVTAWVDDERRGLFEVAMADPGAEVLAHDWVAQGLPRVESGPVAMHAVTGRAVGEPGWYLERPGFWVGGIGVAAVWYGGAVTLARRLRSQATQRPLDQVGRMHLGTVDTTLWAARAVLVEAAREVDTGIGAVAASLLARRVRQVVAEAAERVLVATDHALGPGPLTSERRHAAAVADLRLYLRQHHAERDAAGLGGDLLPTTDGAGTPW